MPLTILVTGATGYVGGSLLQPLRDQGHTVRSLTRHPDGKDLPNPFKGDVSDEHSLQGALDGVQVAYYLVHSMEGDDFAERDREGARNFAKAAKDQGVERVIYLGGLGQNAQSEHLRSREEVAEILREQGPPLVHVRAAMVIGGGSASFIMLAELVERLPAMITPKWLNTRTQPVAIADAVATLAALATFEDPPDEVELGGADVLTYKEMLQGYARIKGLRNRPIVTVPVLTPRLSSYWVTFVTSVDGALARPLVEGLSAEMLVRTPPPAGLNDDPKSFEEAVRAALDRAR
jgi:uncharacterized protein YbjT (DUF2867 family)